MGVSVRAHHGFLGLRIFHRGRDAHVGTKLLDDGPNGSNRRILQAKAAVVAERLAGGVPLHRALLDVLGDCPPHLIPRKERAERKRLRGFYDVWIPTQTAPMLRATEERKRKLYFERIILPELGGLSFEEIDRTELEAFRGKLLREEIGPKAARRKRKLKTIRNIIDGHLRALWRAAEAAGVAGPWPRLEWRRTQRPKPDPFELAERDRIIAWFGAHEAWIEPWVAFLFWTGMRHGEAAALTWSRVDLGRGVATVETSRVERVADATKTSGATRDVALLPPARAALERLPRQLHSDGTELVFRTPEGKGMTDSWWPKRGAARRPTKDDERGVWFRCLRALGIRPRRAYCTRHTFIAWALSVGMNQKALAEYCGTSSTMVEQHYGRFIGDDALAPLLAQFGEADETGRRPVISPSIRRKSAVRSPSPDLRNRGNS